MYVNAFSAHSFKQDKGLTGHFVSLCDPVYSVNVCAL